MRANVEPFACLLSKNLHRGHWHVREVQCNQWGIENQLDTTPRYDNACVWFLNSHIDQMNVFVADHKYLICCMTIFMWLFAHEMYYLQISTCPIWFTARASHIAMCTNSSNCFARRIQTDAQCTLNGRTRRISQPFHVCLFNSSFSMHYKCTFHFRVDFSNTYRRGYIGQRPQCLISNSPLPGY